MKITLVSHASLLIETRGITILTDPWYEGRIYHDAWELCPPPPQLPDFSRLGALFISHGHPDHLEPRTLARIREARGPDLPVFVARFPENTLKPALEELGFRNITEMHPGVRFEAFPGVFFFSQQFRLDDALLVVEGDETLININDCPLRGRVLRDLAQRFRADYVTAQFAIAQGYPYCYENAVEADFTRDDLIARFDSFGQVLQPRHLIPFASFVRFCHADNAHMNAHRTSLEELRAKCRSPLTILYPGDHIERGVPAASPANREHYETAQRSTEAVTACAPVPEARLEQAVHAFLEGMARRVPRTVWRRFPDCALIPTNGTHGFVIRNGRATRLPVGLLGGIPIRYTIPPEVLHECLRFPWGWEDLSIGARFRAFVAPGHEGREIWFWIIPMLAGKGYLDVRNPWLLHPRALRVMWGRRLEMLDYALTAIRGRFMGSVVRRKTEELDEFEHRYDP